jgi:hypothetical protein
MSFDDTQRLKRFARHWDLVFNSGNFVATAPMIWKEPGEAAPKESPFAAFQEWSAWLYEQTGRTDSIALLRLMELLHVYLTKKRHDPAVTAELLWRDYQRGGRREKPEFLRRYPLTESLFSQNRSRTLPKRQRRRRESTPLADPAN